MLTDFGFLDAKEALLAFLAFASSVAPPPPPEEPRDRPPLPDAAMIRAHIEAHHAQARRALEGAPKPGVLQLVTIHPHMEGATTKQFAIGNVDGMVAAAMADTANGFNVYIEGRTVRPGAKGRGKTADTIGVFAFAVDSDADKNKVVTLPVEPSLTVATSAHNQHFWLYLSRALVPQEAEPIGAAIRRAVKGDNDTGTITQPYRVAGTLNYPGKTKIARGRSKVEATRIVSKIDRTFTADELRALFPVIVSAGGTGSAGAGPKGRTGKTSSKVEDLVAEAGADRSGRFYGAVAEAVAVGMGPDDLEELMRLHPKGCAGKYLKPYDRLRKEIERVWTKVLDDIASKANVPPTYPDKGVPVADARKAVDAAIRKFMGASADWHSLKDDSDPPVHAARITTGVGKTQAVVRIVTEHRKTSQDRRPFAYFVPRHALGEQIEADFARRGMRAKGFRGRKAEDPTRPGRKMCEDLEAVDIAMDLGLSVQKACCKDKHPTAGNVMKCQFFDACSYQKQKQEEPDVWILPHDYLFIALDGAGKLAGVIIDESFWQSGILASKGGLTLDEIRAQCPIHTPKFMDVAADLDPLRETLAMGLSRQAAPGGIHRRHLSETGLSAEMCTQAISLEWEYKVEAAIWPGMKAEERRKIAKETKRAKHIRARDRVWRASRELLRMDDPHAVSGRVIMADNDTPSGSVRTVITRGVRAISGQWKAPTFIMDATLPGPEILKAYYPNVEITADIEATMPHVTVRQVLGAPVSVNKLRRSQNDANRNLHSIRRAILYRFVEMGRPKTLVIAQKTEAAWLRAQGLAAGISVEHFNNVSGLDGYKDVGLLITVGRTMPDVFAVEADAGALTGLDPLKTPQPEKGLRWYERVIRSIRLKGGAGQGVECDKHPDPVAEAIRWQICEGELLQAIGRGRGVNRTAATPLVIDILATWSCPSGRCGGAMGRRAG
jgi:putative DNA primase/helicase